MKPKHEIHKLYRTQFKQSGTIIYRCGIPGCPTFFYEPLIVGKISECWRCGESFVITKKTIRNKKLHCEDCTHGKKKIDIPLELDREIEKLLSGE